MGGWEGECVIRVLVYSLHMCVYLSFFEFTFLCMHM